MPLQRQLIDVPIVGGVDEKTDPQLSTRPLQLSNCCYRKSGALEKRYGSELVIGRTGADRIVSQIPTPYPTATPPTPYLLTKYGDSLVRVGARYLHTTSSGGSTWSRVDHVPSVTVTRTPVSMSSSQAWSPDVAGSDTHLCHVWCEATSRFGTGAVWAQISNKTTGEVVSSPYYLGLGRQSKVCAQSNGEFIATWVDSVTGDIKAATSSASTFLWGTITTIITDGVKATGSLITAYALETLANAYAIAYETSTNVLKIKVFTNGHTLTTTTNTGFTFTPVTAVAMDWQNGERLWWAAIGVTGGTKRMQFGSLTPAFALETSNTTVEDTEIVATQVVTNQTYQNLGIRRVTDSSAVIVYDTCRSSTVAGISLVVVDTGPTAGTPVRMNGALSVTSKPWIVGDRLLFAACQSPRWGQGYSDADHLIFEASTEPPSEIVRVVGRYGPGIGAYPLPYSHVSGVSVSGNDAYVALSFASDTSTETAVNTSLWSCKASVIHAPTRGAVELGGALYLTGGVTSVFDGATVAEVGFISPPMIEATSSPGAATGMPAGTYTYVACWEGIDAAGRLHRSAPSTPVAVVAALNDRVDIAVVQTSATTKQDDAQAGAASGKWPFAVNLAVFRLQNGEYYRITSAIGGSANYYPAYYQTYSDSYTYTTTTILAQPKLYTSGNVSPHVAPPGCSVIAAHQSRIFTDSDDGTIWYSNPVAPGEIAAFTLDFRIPPFEGGAITGLVSLDSSLVIFKRDSIWILGGQGPNPTGGGEQYGLPQVLTADIGCTNARSIVVCPVGIFFQSADGITLLSRSLQLNTDVGNRIETTLGTLPTIGSATHVPDQNQVRFELYSSSDNIRAVYDYHNDAWSTDSVYTPDSVDEVSSPSFGAELLGGVYYWVTEDGSLYRETTSSWLDSGYWVYMIATFSNLRAGAIDSMVRLWRVAMNVYRYSSAGALFNVRSWTAAEIDALGSGRIQLQEHVASQLKEYIQLSFVDTPPDTYGTGRGFSLTGLTLEVGVRGTTSRRLPAGARK